MAFSLDLAGADGLAWMLFDRDAMWRGDTPPKPAWWEHQLSAGPPELHWMPRDLRHMPKR